MTVDERRRIALHRAAAASWGEEVADTLVDLVVPAGYEMATRQDIEGVLTAIEAMDTRWDERLTALEQRWDDRFTALEQRWDDRFTALEQRWDERFALSEAQGAERSDRAFEHTTDLAVVQQERFDAQIEGLRHELLSAFERRFADAVNHQTRTLVVSQLVALVAIAGLAFGLQ